MWVAAEYRGLGLGRDLLLEAIRWSRQSRALKMVLGVTTGDTPARQLYESVGFTVVGDIESLRPGEDLTMQTLECYFSNCAG
jgi:ribosomal protein S18 acetylase RimI-like enzyme